MYLNRRDFLGKGMEDNLTNRIMMSFDFLIPYFLFLISYSLFS
jgi:hypothetical protein